MLYVIHCRNHPELAYRGGQEPIVHLEADLHDVAECVPRPLAAAGKMATQRNIRWVLDVERGSVLRRVPIATPGARPTRVGGHPCDRLRAPDVKEHKQAEFLVHESFPFALVERIGVRSGAIGATAATALAGGPHQPRIEVRREWYF